MHAENGCVAWGVSFSCDNLGHSAIILAGFCSYILIGRHLFFYIIIPQAKYYYASSLIDGVNIEHRTGDISQVFLQKMDAIFGIHFT